MILADSSAWIEFLRRTGSTADLRVDKLVRTGELVTTDAVVMEILAGARNVAHRRSLAGLLARFRFEPTEGPGDYEAAADVYAACRRSGETVRSLSDCLIACVAMRAGLELLHAGGDFEAIARHVPLKLAK